MNQSLILLTIAFLCLTGCAMNNPSDSGITNNKLVIAHRGASGYLPEHSIAAKAMAYAMGADYIEQDVVMTKDNHLIVLHDPYLDRITNVMSVYPDRYRENFGEKRWFAIDFSLQEIKGLSMTEAFSVNSKTNKLTTNYPSRFPLFKSSFHVSTLEEEIELIQGLNHSTGKNIGIYVEIKTPWFHQYEGKDISKATLKVLKDYGYITKEHKVFVQCFDPDETRRINDQLMPELGIDLNLVQLIAQTSWNETMRFTNGKLVPYSYDWFFEAGAMAKIAEYADAIGPWKSMLVTEDSEPGNLKISSMVKDAHAVGMQVHPYTFRADEERIPKYANSFDQLLDIFFYTVGVDGIFTDFPDKAVQFLQK
ncbi:MAG: glycerophosphodiester phosphodiesterase [Gammaproteobacteria bacterium]|nr:glycerophosphodiester phosphodiesterase [Gammaproteobacteria bacterium]